MEDIEFFKGYNKEQLVEMCNYMLEENKKLKKKVRKYESYKENEENRFKILKDRIKAFEENGVLETEIKHLLHLNKEKYSDIKDIPKALRLEKTIKSLQKQIGELQYKVNKTQTVSNECPGKAMYSSDIEAEMALSTIRSKGKVRDTTPIRAYKCSACKKFHLTSKKKNNV